MTVVALGPLRYQFKNGRSGDDRIQYARVCLHPDGLWMEQDARKRAMGEAGELLTGRRGSERREYAPSAGTGKRWTAGARFATAVQKSRTLDRLEFLCGTSVSRLGMPLRPATEAAAQYWPEHT